MAETEPCGSPTQRRRCRVAGDPVPFFRDRNLLFVHIPKNAGRSIEAALLGPTGSPDGGRRSWPNRLATGLQRWTAAVDVSERLIGTLDVTVAAQHLTLAEIELLGLLPADRLAHCRRFCVCRNPFDRAVSSVFHFCGNPQDQAAFERALGRWLDGPPRDHNELAHRRSQAAYLRDSRGHPAVPHVLRFERLSDDFSQMMAEFRLDGVSLPCRGRSRRARSHRDYFNLAARRAVERAYAEDLDQFNYAF
jgi:hypothetical protein